VALLGLNFISIFHMYLPLKLSGGRILEEVHCADFPEYLAYLEYHFLGMSIREPSDVKFGVQSRQARVISTQEL
jgi:hypothetical protein